MKNKLLGMMAFIFIILFLVACGTKATVTPKIVAPTSPALETESSTSEAPVDPTVTTAPITLDGNAILERTCTRCHTLDRVKSSKKDISGWTTTVDRMMGKGAVLTADEKATLIEYLAATYK